VSIPACALALSASSAAAATPFEFGSFGSEAGQLNLPSGVAIGASGDIYVGDVENDRVDKFDSAGKFVLAWGVGVADGASELQICTTACRPGVHSAIAGGFEFPTGVGVDASGNVYVMDKNNLRIQKFGPDGHFILMFGGQVNENGTNVCLATESAKCQAGVEGTADGEFSFWFGFSNRIAVGPGNKVYVGDTGRVQVFEPTSSGGTDSIAWKESISLVGLSIEGQPTELAVDSSGNVFLKDSEATGVREFDASGLEKPTQFDKESSSVTALAVDPTSGDLYVGDENGGFHVLKYDPTGTELASFGSNTVSGFNGGMAVSGTTSELYASEAAEGEKAGVWVLTPPPPGPLIEGESATAGLKGAATLQAQVNPEGNETTYHLEYVDQAHFQASGYATATSTPSATIGLQPNLDERFVEEPVEAKLAEATLTPGETYHWRVVATDSLNHTTTGADESFEETPPALVEGPWTENVAATSATLAAKINPLQANTDYRLEYGTTTSYEHVLTGNVGEGNELVLISHHVQELEPSTTYHYRIMTTSEVGTVKGADHTFTTQPAGASELGLPDGRAWELVSPAITGGAVLGLLSGGRQAASDGNTITYPVRGVPLGEHVESNESVASTQVLSLQSASGWRSEDINPPKSPPEEGLTTNVLSGAGYSLFSLDLAEAVVATPPGTSLSSEGLEGTKYLRNNADASYVPLLTPANVPPGTDLMAPEPPFFEKKSQVTILAGTPGLGQVLIGSPLKLTEEAVATGTPIHVGIGNVYEWSGGRLQLVNRLPDGKATCPPEAGVGCEDAVGVHLAGEPGAVARAVSSDGRRVAWTRGEPYGAGNRQSYKGLYLRDMGEGKTVELGGHDALYQTMSSDGSHVFFLERGELYEYDAATGAQTDLTANHDPGEASAGVQESVSDVSEDGSDVYFVAKGKLAEGAVSGEDNLYLLHDAGGQWATSYVATLSSEDEPSWHASGGTPEPDLTRVTSRVSPDGRYLAFMSQRSLTGYDNIDAVSGQPDVEVYLYDGLAGRLVCASCDPSGSRPVGVDTSKQHVVEPAGNPPWGQLGHPHWLAGNLPGWQRHGGPDTVYQPRYLSDSGRLFFNSPDSLVPHDTNGLEDVYQYEPPGVGGCTSASATFSLRSGGCVNLISSGTSSAESAFFDASESGEDVFFIASDHLTAADSDTGYDVWDAHVCSASVPCVAPRPVSPPACSSGDSCKPAPAPQPELFGAAPSATFSGAGNIPATPAVAPRPLTRAQKLARALKACKKKPRQKRRACVRQAKWAYGPGRKAKKSTKGASR
jgi:hypothetical protein